MSIKNKFLNAVIVGVLVNITGCASFDKPGYKVDINSQPPEKITEPAEQESITGASEINPSFDAVFKYGNGRDFNKVSKKKFSSNKGEYSLDFVNISIEEFTSIVFTEMLGKNYVFDSTIKGDVTVQTRGQLDARQLLSIVESVLASRNAVMVAEDEHFKIIPIAKAKNYSLKPELYSARNIKPGYRMVIVPVNYVNPEDLKSVLESVSPGAGHLKIDKERRAIVITGSEQEITNVVDAVQIFDVSWLEKKSIAVLPVEKTQASIIKKEITKILESQNKSHGIVLDTIDRFNALLVVADKKKEIDAVKSWLNILDQDTPKVETQLFVYDVQNRKASELTDLLNGIFNEGASLVSSDTESKNSKTASTKEVVVTNKKTVTKNETTKKEKPSSLRIVADEINNSIVILSTKAEYDSIFSIIKKLDVLPMQVLIEVSIVEVTLSDELSYGLEWYLRHNGISDKFNSDTTLDLNAGAGIGAIAPGFSFLLSGSGSLVQAVFNTLAAESKLNVISSPSLMALDNHTATIRVGDQQPVQVASAKSSNNDVLTQSIEYKSTGVLLSVTPRVNSGGLVTMELSQEVTDIGSIDDATGQRSFLQRNINTTVAVQDGRTIILGGLITENNVEAESGIPGAYKWPIIGRLFGKKANSKIKRELIVLITPKVIFNHQNALDITKEYAEKMQLLKSSIVINE
ncbi:MAG: type II secretion system secretin GspD [Gammaproteobacteria bacterium]|jgi:general secretion pathway protein D|nr:type II secretion system secretin GspD [Gammaproteobacteria bacterium]MBT3725232.1 type II secretion system secretin GspD [Gammaproteobacteria bacterium]MBT4195196.1 type II secretion system secretin GspD [Gammaproteobacteria bacterium]MBT4449884.1 type II secretion system secretin GspD [Gammaproteobacteria bacterium]MBT4863425.1 type II secretion system secretin GspD [Gammaproteobacteria bacterium]